jgi:hypothetical protein
VEEKFYYSKRFLRGMLILGIASTFASIIPVVQMFAKGLPLISTQHLYSLQFVSFAIGAVGAFWIILKVKGKPAIIITDHRIFFGPYMVKKVFLDDSRKPELNFGQIISATILERKPPFCFERRIEIRVRKPDNRVCSCFINLLSIDTPEKLIEILKQRIKFE